MGDKITKSPNIRFKGFTDDWEQRKLGDVFEEYSEKNHEELPPLTIIQGKGTIRRDKSDRNLQFNKKSLLNYKMVEKDDFIVHLRSFEGGFEKSNFTGIISPAYHTLHGNGADSSFYYAYFRSYNFINIKLKPHVYGVRDGRSVDMAGVKTINIPFTSLNEQKKIGDFIESLDNLITLHQRKLDLLKVTKKSMLQKMFPKDGESIPEIRFEGFTDAWEQRKLGEIASLITKGTTPKDKSGDGEVNFIKVENIDDSSGEISGVSKISLEEHQGYLKRSQLQEGDILFSIAGTLGRVTSVNKGVLPANTNQALAIIRLKEGSLEYVKTCLKGNVVADFIRRNPTVGAQPNLSLEQVSSLEIEMPSMAEQKKIGEFFSGLDTLINLHQRELDLLKDLKKSMLQQMFI